MNHDRATIRYLPSSASDDIEFTNLIGRNDDSRADNTTDSDDVFVAPSSERNYSKLLSSPNSGFSRSDKLGFLFALISGIVVVTSLVLFHSVENLNSNTSLSVDDDDRGDTSSSSSVVNISRWPSMRWEPSLDTESDNCIPRFRLANSTIHCGVGNVSPLNVSFDGPKYCGGVKMEPNSCVLPLEGRWPLPSPTQSSISGETTTLLPSLPRRFGINVNPSILPRCATMQDYMNGTYQGPKYDREWVPKTCTAVPFSPFAWTQNAQTCQTTITMIGDSHVRNAFTATVNGLRGIRAFAEAHADEASKARGIAESYEWRWNGDGTASDHVGVYANTKTNEPAFFEDCPCNAEVIRCLRIIFLWAPTFGEQLSQMHLARKWESDLVIVEPGNAYEHSVVLSSEWTAKLDEMLDEDENLQLGILHFVWGSQPVGERRGALTEWTTSWMHPDRKSYLPQDSMNDNDGLQGRMTFHYACGLGRVDAGNDNINAAEPCTDVVDTAQIRAFITVHFNALSN